MYNVYHVVREDYKLLHRIQLNKSPMHKGASLQFAKSKAKKLNIRFDDGSWRNYLSCKSPLGDTIEISPL